MEELQNLPREAVLALVGIGIAVVLLAVLSVLQTSRQKREGAQKFAKLKAEGKGKGDAAAGTTPFFVACYDGYNARFFRVYMAAGELLFLNAGPYFAMIDAESVRDRDGRHWLLRSLRLLWVALGVLAVGALVSLAVISRAMVRAATQNPDAARDIFTIVLGIIALLAVLLVVAIPVTLWQITQRGRELDALSLSDLRAQAQADKKSFRATPETVSEFNVALLDQRDNFKPSQDVGCRITFKDSARGRWKIETFTTGDTRAALEALRAEWGENRVLIEPKLHARLTEAGALPQGMKPPVIKPEVTVPQEEEAPVRGGTFSMNGIGTMCVEVRGEVDWGDRMEDCDAILAFCIVGVPIIPYSAIHTTEWKSYDPKVGIGGHTYRSIPIRWTWGLVWSALFRRSWWLMLLPGFYFVLEAWSGDADWMSGDPSRVLGFLVGALLIVLPALGRWWYWRLDQPHRDIRLLLGRHLLGSSDPFFWTRSNLELVRSPQEVFGTATFAEAVPQALAAGDYCQAMFAARLAAALESRSQGLALTGTVLDHPQVQELLPKLRSEPKQRAQIMPAKDWSHVMVFAGAAETLV